MLSLKALSGVNKFRHYLMNFYLAACTNMRVDFFEVDEFVEFGDPRIFTYNYTIINNNIYQ